VLVLSLLVVAVAALVVGLGAVTNASDLKANPTFGTADTIVAVPGADTSTVSADVAVLEQRFGTVEVISHESVPIPGSVSSLDIRAEDPNGPYGHVMLRLDSGRYPTGPNDVAITDGTAKTFDLKVGDNWSVNGRSLTVVGTVENPLDLLDEFALVAPGQATAAATTSFLLNAGNGSIGELHLPGRTGASIETRGTTSKTLVAAVVLIIGALGMVFVGLMSVAGFAVMAQRRLRALGMLRSLGATDRHLRLVMLANGGAVGVTAAIVGTAVGLAAWFALIPTIESIAEHRIDAFALPWWAIGAAMALTVVTALFAAWWPARVVSKISAIAALSGRPPRPQPAHRFAAVGGALLATGLVLLAFADLHRVGFILGGTVTTAVGMLLLAPLAIRVLAAFAGRSSIAVTLALRDLARYQARSGAALGAVTMAIGIAATIAISASAAQPTSVAGNLPNNELILHVTQEVGDPGYPTPLLTPAQLSTVTNAVDQLAQEIHATAKVSLDQAYDPNSSQEAAPPQVGHGRVSTGPGQADSGGQPRGYLTATLAKVTHLGGGGEGISGTIPLYLATPELLAHYGIASDDVAPGADIISSRTDLGGLQILDPRDSPGRSAATLPTDATRPTIQPIDKLPDYSSAPGTLLTSHGLQALGLKAIPSAWLLQVDHPLTADEINTARKTAAQIGLYVETHKPKASLAPLRNWATACGILLALSVLAMTVGLIRSETSNDLRTLAATGASSRTRRAVTGATAGALAALGAIVGTAGAYAALLAWHRSDLTPLSQVPVLNLVTIIVGLPVLAAAGGWLLAGREPAAIARQPLQ
jgi:putative ABC transport system permease protein